MNIDPTLLTGGAGVLGLLAAITRAAGAIKGAAGEVKTLVSAVGENTTETKNLAGEFKAYREKNDTRASTVEGRVDVLEGRVGVLEGTVPQWPARS